SEVLVDNKRLKTEKNPSSSVVGMEVDNPRSCATETSTKLPSDSEIKKLSKDELISLNERLSRELKGRDEGEAGLSSDFQQFTTSELKEAKSKFENALNSFKTSNTTNNDDKGSNVG